MNIEEYLNHAVDPAAIVSDLIKDLCTEYEENPLTVAYENNMKKFEELQYIEPDDFLLDIKSIQCSRDGPLFYPISI
jgi:hypothetical protein